MSEEMKVPGHCGLKKTSELGLNGLKDDRIIHERTASQILKSSNFGGKYPFIQTGDVREANGGFISKYSQTYSEKGLKQSKLWPKGTLCIKHQVAKKLKKYEEYKKLTPPPEGDGVVTVSAHGRSAT